MILTILQLIFLTLNLQLRGITLVILQFLQLSQKSQKIIDIHIIDIHIIIDIYIYIW